MKIGILTQPLHTNYGGLLQAYALQTVLKRMGHEPWIVRRVSAGRSHFRQSLYNVIKVLLGRKPYYLMNVSEAEYVAKNVRIFRDKYITPVTPLLDSTAKLSARTLTDDYDALVVGSDQVWRPVYSPCITNYFLDFAEGRSVRRIAYAASFGVDSWEFSSSDTNTCARLAKLFDAVSVREASACDLCKKHLGVDALHVLDPTMLLEASDYERIVEAEGEPPCEGNLFCYVLDEAPEKASVLADMAARQGLTPFTSMPRLKFSRENFRADAESCVFPRVTRWLRSFMDADMVLTDSFHGCVFSIIFNKPFWVIGNRERGMARFHSLLAMYGLEDRLITPDTAPHIAYDTPIDWNSVNNKRHEYQAQSLNFLTNSLHHE